MTPNLCLGERLDGPNWSGCPIGRFSPPGQESPLAVATTQDTLFVWLDGASTARVRSRGETIHYQRHNGVLDLMAVDEQALISHDNPGHAGTSLLVGFPEDLRTRLGGDEFRHSTIRSHFDVSDPHLSGLAHALIAQCQHGEPYGRLYTESISTALVAYLYRKYDPGTSPPVSRFRARSGQLSLVHQQKVVNLIHSQLSQDIGLSDLAAVTGYSQAHFLRLFKATFSTTPYRFLTELRVQEAKRLLRGRHQALADVARACGFADQSHFNTVFAHHVGMPPGRYRSQVLS